MAGPIMRGATRAREFISTYLEGDLPKLITAARAEWGLEPHLLPYPVKYDSYDPLKMDDYPTIGSVIRRTGNWRRRDIIDAEEHYSANYSVMLFVWVATPEGPNGNPDDTYGETLRLRDDMLGLIRSCLLTRPSFGSEGETKMNENTLSEDYLDAMRISEQSNLWLAGGTITFDMQVSEQNRDIPYGIVENVSLEGSNIGMIEMTERNQ